MWNQIWSAAKGLAGSKKFQAAAMSAILWAGGKLGLHLSTEELVPIVGPLWLYVFGQGLADFGKSAALVAAKTVVLLFVLVLAVSQTTACAAAKQEVAAVEAAAIDCTKGRLAPVVAEFAPVLEALLIRSTGGDGKVDWAQVGDATKGFAQDTGGCVLAESVQALLHPPAPKPGAPASSPLVVDANDLLAHYQAHRAIWFAGAHFHTALGDL